MNIILMDFKVGTDDRLCILWRIQYLQLSQTTVQRVYLDLLEIFFERNYPKVSLRGPVSLILFEPF